MNEQAPSKARVSGARFISAWIDLARLPGGMMTSSSIGNFGPVAAMTSCLITTDETVMQRWVESGKPVLEIQLADSAHEPPAGPPWAFDRYQQGRLMAQGITIEREETFEAAAVKAARMADRLDVLVLRPAPPPPVDELGNLRDPDAAVSQLLQSYFWLKTLKPNTRYARLQDDHDGKHEGWLSVTIGEDGDAWVSLDDDARFRMPCTGGGRSQYTRAALVILAEAIRRDNAESPLRPAPTKSGGAT